MTNKLRIYEFAKLLDMKNKDLMDVLNKLNIEHKNHMSALEENDINLVLEYILQEKDKQQAERRAERRNVSKDQQVQEKRQKIEDRKLRKFDEKPRHERKVEEKEKVDSYEMKDRKKRDIKKKINQQSLGQETKQQCKRVEKL